MGSAAPVQWAALTNRGRKPGDLSFHQSLASFAPTAHDSRQGNDDRLCSGTAASSLLARTKSIVEALERYYSGAVRVDATGSPSEINAAYDHSAFAPLTDQQVTAQGGRLAPWDDDKSIEWVRARRLIGLRDFYVPVDVAFYPVSPDRLQRRLVAFANSNGVAGHRTTEQARKHALLELLERDAILRSWYVDDRPLLARRQDWPAHLTRRADHWRENGWATGVYRFASPWAIVIGVTLRNPNAFPHFCFGSAATLDALDVAILKAFHEAEATLAGYRVQQNPEKVVRADSLRTPSIMVCYTPSRIIRR